MYLLWRHPQYHNVDVIDGSLVHVSVWAPLHWLTQFIKGHLLHPVLTSTIHQWQRVTSPHWTGCSDLLSCLTMFGQHFIYTAYLQMQWNSMSILSSNAPAIRKTASPSLHRCATSTCTLSANPSSHISVINLPIGSMVLTTEVSMLLPFTKLTFWCEFTVDCKCSVVVTNGIHIGHPCCGSHNKCCWKTTTIVFAQSMLILNTSVRLSAVACQWCLVSLHVLTPYISM